MAKVSGTCAACGAAVELTAPAAFAGASLVAPLCPACGDRQFIDNGGAVLSLREPVSSALFPVVKITITPGAATALAASGQHAWEFVTRHARGDWGENGRFEEIALTEAEARLGWEVTDDSGKINKSNVLNHRDSVMSAYRTRAGKELWVVSQFEGRGGTTVLLPQEY